MHTLYLSISIKILGIDSHIRYSSRSGGTRRRPTVSLPTKIRPTKIR